MEILVRVGFRESFMYYKKMWLKKNITMRRNLIQ